MIGIGRGGTLAFLLGRTLAGSRRWTVDRRSQALCSLLFRRASGAAPLELALNLEGARSLRAVRRRRERSRRRAWAPRAWSRLGQRARTFEIAGVRGRETPGIAVVA